MSPPLQVGASIALRIGLPLVVSFALHFAIAGSWIAHSAQVLGRETPGVERLEDAPTGDGGGELLVPSEPVQVALFVAPDGAVAPVAAEGGAGSAPSGSRGGGSTKRPSHDIAALVAENQRRGVAGRPPRGSKKPCEPVEEVTRLGNKQWNVERSLVDWYATHLRQLDKQAGAAFHRDPEGKRDGVRLYLPRCSVLKQGGLRNKDVVHTINGRKIQTMAQAVTTYLAVRGEPEIVVELTRQGQARTHRYHLR